MNAAESLAYAIARKKESKPWNAFVNQNPKVAPPVVAYLSGGPRPTDSQLGNNKYALDCVYTEDARRQLTVKKPSLPSILDSHGDVFVTVPGPVVNGRAEVAFIS